MTNEELINQYKKEIALLTSQIDKSKINYNLPMGSWVSHKEESEISDRERLTIDDAIHDTEVMKEYLEHCDEPRSEGLGVLIDIAYKYQKIQKIINGYDATWELHHMKSTIDKIKEVIHK